MLKLVHYYFNPSWSVSHSSVHWESGNVEKLEVGDTCARATSGGRQVPPEVRIDDIAGSIKFNLEVLSLHEIKLIKRNVTFVIPNRENLTVCFRQGTRLYVDDLNRLKSLGWLNRWHRLKIFFFPNKFRNNLAHPSNKTPVVFRMLHY